ncbi:hypothetical protein RhiirA4_427970 [Rhizophagus irregularis]|uniref:Uncharacterized protein n=1 Tax=Rhizophagus irregularis TaxID=588596 RepID=A0A2I1HAZ6_9GLOM|nr:hypothetical protein RhiirA4_427970 [Rhizophagus irregularis]
MSIQVFIRVIPGSYLTKDKRAIPVLASGNTFFDLGMIRLSKVFKPLKISSKDALYSKVYDFLVDDFNDQKINKTSKISSIFRASDKSLSKVFETLKISSKNGIQNDHEKETIQQMKESVNVICMVYIVGVIDYSPQSYKREYNGGDGISAMHTQLDVDSSHQILELIKLDDIFNEDPPKPIYFEDSDILIVSLVYSTLPTRFLKTEMEDIKVGTDNVGILFVYHFTVPAIIAEELTSEEKENHKKKSKEKSERLLNWSKSIIRKYNM